MENYTQAYRKAEKLVDRLNQTTPVELNKESVEQEVRDFRNELYKSDLSYSEKVKVVDLLFKMPLQLLVKIF